MNTDDDFLEFQAVAALASFNTPLKNCSGLLSLFVLASLFFPVDVFYRTFALTHAQRDILSELSLQLRKHMRLHARNAV